MKNLIWFKILNVQNFNFGLASINNQAFKNLLKTNDTCDLKIAYPTGSASSSNSESTSCTSSDILEENDAATKHALDALVDWQLGFIS